MYTEELASALSKKFIEAAWHLVTNKYEITFVILMNWEDSYNNWRKYEIISITLKSDALSVAPTSSSV